jgi:NAD(P)H-hydrate epimerase
LSQYFNCITVLKGPGTIVVSPQGEIAINPTGNPNLATAGSGDVLTGIIAAFLAQGGSPFISAVTGVFLHGLSADLYQKQSPQLLASELASYLPYAIKVVKNCEYRLPIVDGD